MRREKGLGWLNEESSNWSRRFEGGGVNDVVKRGDRHLEEGGIGSGGGEEELMVVLEHESGGFVIGDLVVTKLGGQVGLFEVVGENDVVFRRGFVGIRVP